MKESPFFKQADLLLRLLAHVTTEPDFALHGGTAINFFVRDMPRLSVDIDLTYLPLESREDSLANITQRLHALAKKFRNAFPGIQIEEKEDQARSVSKLFVNYQNALVKIEPNLIIRGSVFPLDQRDLSKNAEKRFEKFVSVKTLPLAALYGGKICAALDRQHPRDLFDIKLLFENEGFSNPSLSDAVRYTQFLTPPCRTPSGILNMSPKRGFKMKWQRRDYSLANLTPPSRTPSSILDRQHPRDLFDIKLLFENEGFSNPSLSDAVRYTEAHLVKQPSDYPHTSFHYYANGQRDKLLDPSPVYLALSDNKEERRKIYARYVTETRIQDEMAEKGLLVG